MSAARLTFDHIARLLGSEASALLGPFAPKVARQNLQLPGPHFLRDVWSLSDRSPAVLTNMDRLFKTGRLAGTGYLSFLAVDQGVEHGAGASFAPNPLYFDPENIVRLALEGGTSGVASSVGVLGMVSEKYAQKIPFVVKLNHNELLSYPNRHDQTMFAQAEQAANMGAAAVGATIYFGAPESRRQIEEVSFAFARAHELGLVTILWCYVRNDAFTVDGVNHERSADLTGQANYLGATLQADIVKQKLPESNGGFAAVRTGTSDYGKLDERMYADLASDHPIDLCRYQVLNGFAGRVGLITSGGEAGGNDLAGIVRTAVINKRAGGMGLIAGRKVFRQPTFAEGVAMLHAAQDVYLCADVTVA